MRRLLLISGLSILGLLKMESQYISEVLEYVPAPGQFTNAFPWGTPSAAASIVGGVNGSLCLGAYGGYVVFAFEDAVENHPDNPYGVDFTLFGNPMPHWSEPGLVWVMEDRNNNGLPDDAWYELAGSDFYFSSTLRDYQVSYENPGDTVAREVPWSDQFGNTGKLKINSLHTQSYYPSSDSFPMVSADRYTLGGTLILGAVDTEHPPVLKSARRAFGYADNQLRGDTGSLLPDNPYTPEVEHMGGDAFDIAWAVNSSGAHVDLDRVHFIKVQNGMLADGAWLGELSTEVTGAVDVGPDPSIIGELDLIVIKDLPDQIDTPEYQLEVFVFHQGRMVSEPLLEWALSPASASVDENLVLRLTEPGTVTLTASLSDRPQISSTVSTTFQLTQTSLSGTSASHPAWRIYPNPAREAIQVSGIGETNLSLYNSRGQRVGMTENYGGGVPSCESP